jgi:hypothetical protein
MNRGYIKLWRKIVDWDWFSDANTLQLFLYLLCRANHKTSHYHGTQINKGDVVFGRLQAAKDLHSTERQIRTGISHLKSTGEIAIKTTNKFSIITLINFNKYHDETELIDQQNVQQNAGKTTSNRPATDQQPTTSKELKNINTKELNNTTYCETSHNSVSNEEVVVYDEQVVTHDQFRKQRKEKLAKVDAAPTREVLDYFAAQYLAHNGEKMFITWGKDMKLVKRLLDQMTKEEVCALIDKFFARAASDSFIKESGTQLGVFISQINKLKTANKPNSKATNTTWIEVEWTEDEKEWIRKQNSGCNSLRPALVR